MLKKVTIIILCITLLIISFVSCATQEQADRQNNAPYPIGQVKHRICFYDTFVFSDDYEINNGILTIHGYWERTPIRTYFNKDLVIGSGWVIYEVSDE